MAYPPEILPRPGYKIIDCDLSDFFLLRIVFPQEDVPIVDDETGKINLGYICSPRERIIDLSFNLLGIYTENHINIKLTEEGNIKYNHYCAPDAQVDTPELNVNYITEENRNFWCIAIDQLMNRSFDYTKGEETLHAVCRVVHTPMLWNFWHFSLHWQIEDQLITNPNDLPRKTAHKIGHAVRVLLSQFLKLGLPEEYSTISEECFSVN